jgi:lipopolysaccharide biosynthesis glycosyltransferase
MSNEINIACSADDNFAQHLCVTLFSLMENVSNTYQINVFILDGGISELKRKKIIESLARFEKQARLHFISIDLCQFKDFNETKAISRATYPRIRLAEICPELDRILYLDADIVVEGDVSEIYFTDFHDKAICAVADPNSLLAQTYAETLNIVKESFFNAGVILINLDAFRKHNIADTVFAKLKTVEGVTDDQIALNAVLYDQWEPLDPVWNFLAGLSFRKSNKYTTYTNEQLSNAQTHPKIIHYASPFVKPWLFESIGPFKERYYFYLDKTAFRNFKTRRTISKFLMKVVYIVGYEYVPEIFLIMLRKNKMMMKALSKVLSV